MGYQNNLGGQLFCPNRAKCNPNDFIIIVIDFIDLKNDENKRELMNIFKQELKKERTKIQIEGFTKLNLLELTRKHICSE